MSDRHLRPVECAILIPAGPDTSVGFLADTIASVHHYIGRAASHVVIVDDSRDGRFRDLRHEGFGVTVIDAPDCREGAAAVSQRGSLFTKQAAGLRWLMKHVRFEALLKMDSDALVTGPAPHHDAIALWGSRSNVGVIGALTRRGDGTDKADAMARKGRQLSGELRGRGLRWSGTVVGALQDPRHTVTGILNRLRWMGTLHRMVREAERRGYVRGATCTGGAYFVNPRLLRAMEDHGFLEPACTDLVALSGLSEDSLVGLIAHACGFCLSDPSPDRDALAINWRGMPMAPDEVVRRGKKIVHPIKDDRHAEAEVRAFFASRREAGLNPRSAT